MQIAVAGKSEQGPVRSKNDDHYCVGPFVEQAAMTSLTIDTASAFFTEYGLLAAVADGIGGYPGGDVASRIALETLSALFYGERRRGCKRDELGVIMERYIAQTNDVLCSQLSRTPEFARAGTTLAGIVLLPPDILLIFHAGDSRVLRASAGFVRIMTTDHTPLGPDLASGRITDAEASQLREASLLTRSLGQHGNAAAEIDATQNWATGDRFLIGTDGWHGAGRGLPRARIQEIVRQGDDATALISRLLHEALSVDGHDNATVVVVDIAANGAAHG